MTMTIKTHLAALVGLAAELQAVGAVRSEHDTKFQQLRIGLDQAIDQADADEATANTPPTPDAGAFDALAQRVEGLALVVDHMSDQVAELVTAAKGGA